MSEESQKPPSEPSKAEYAIGGVIGGIVVSAIAFFCFGMMLESHEASKECRDIRRELEATDRTAYLRFADQKQDHKLLENLHLRVRDLEDLVDKLEQESKQ